MNWHLQVCSREWVVWWYGPLPAGAPGHIDPAVSYVPFMEDEHIELPFELPKHRDGMAPAQEIRRASCWGWRFRTNDGIQDGGWNLAESKEACIAQAREFAGRLARDRSMLLDAANDVREYRTGLW